MFEISFPENPKWVNHACCRICSDIWVLSTWVCIGAIDGIVNHVWIKLQLFFPLQSLLAKQPATPTRGATVSVDGIIPFSLHSMFFLLDRQSILFVCDHSLALVSVLQESPGRTASGSPRPAGRAGQPSVTSSSPMAAVKKPDPNMKGWHSEYSFIFIHDYWESCQCSLICAVLSQGLST